MTKEETKLVIKDICGRLSFGVFVDENIEKLDKDPVIYMYDYHPYIDRCKPYLRPMDSMTEEEREELSDYLCEQVMSNKIGITIPPNPTQGKGIPFIWMGDCINWLNKKMFDYRGLIPMGLALPAKEGMYNN